VLVRRGLDLDEGVDGAAPEWDEKEKRVSVAIAAERSDGDRCM
jgi:hypothetical protein